MEYYIPKIQNKIVKRRKTGILGIVGVTKTKFS